MPKVATTCRSCPNAATAQSRHNSATKTAFDFMPLFQQFDVPDSARSIPGPPDAVRIARIDFDPAMILFCVGERELCKRPRRRIETRNLIGMLLAEPDQFAFRIALDGIRTGVLSWRIEESHLRCLVIHLH